MSTDASTPQKDLHVGDIVFIHGKGYIVDEITTLRELNADFNRQQRIVLSPATYGFVPDF